MTHRVATVDVGTNSILLHVSEKDGAGIRSIIDRATITRLGRGVDRTGALERERIEQTLAVLETYCQEARELGASRILAVGTSALRDATNARDFLSPAAALLGAPVEVISGRREAELTYAGAVHGLEIGDRQVTLFDVGGGSTELAAGKGHRLDQAASIDIGAVRLHERHIKSDPPTPEEMAALLADARAELERCPVEPRGALVGIAGTVTTLAAMEIGLTTYDGLEVHGLELTRAQVESLRERLGGTPLLARRELPGLDPGRADVIVAGAGLVSAILAWAGAESLVVSDGGVRVGLALEALNG